MASTRSKHGTGDGRTIETGHQPTARERNRKLNFDCVMCRQKEHIDLTGEDANWQILKSHPSPGPARLGPGRGGKRGPKSITTCRSTFAPHRKGTLRNAGTCGPTRAGSAWSAQVLATWGPAANIELHRFHVPPARPPVAIVVNVIVRFSPPYTYRGCRLRRYLEWPPASAQTVSHPLVARE